MTPGRRIVVACQCGLVRTLLNAVIEGSRIGNVVAEATSGSEALRATRESKADFLLLEGTLPGQEPTELIREIRRLGLGTKVMVFSLNGKGVMREVRLLLAGASGCLSEAECEREIQRAFEAAERGGVYTAGELRELLENGEVEAAKASSFELTPMERSILKQIAEGYTSREIADRSYVSVETVNTHRKMIKRKTGLEGIAEITRYALREGLIEP